jgi:ribosome-associated protein
MPSPAGVHLGPTLTVPASELEFRATRAGGPGGQHVNRSSTRVELWWNIARSPSLSPEDRDWLLARLAGRLSAEGAIRVVASETRSQAQNRAAALRRLGEIVRRALVRPKARKRTRPPRSAHEARLAGKRRRSERKRERRKPGPGPES